jgi:predicted Fe-S protein YdhL (DUF1289 family)
MALSVPSRERIHSLQNMVRRHEDVVLKVMMRFCRGSAKPSFLPSFQAASWSSSCSSDRVTAVTADSFCGGCIRSRGTAVAHLIPVDVPADPVCGGCIRSRGTAVAHLIPVDVPTDPFSGGCIRSRGTAVAHLIPVDVPADPFCGGCIRSRGTAVAQTILVDVPADRSVAAVYAVGAPRSLNSSRLMFLPTDVWGSSPPRQVWVCRSTALRTTRHHTYRML